MSLNIDQTLLREAQRLGGRRTKRETVNEALEEYVRRRKQLHMLEAFGTIEFDEQYDHKSARKQR